jgi:hypothetical protein
MIEITKTSFLPKAYMLLKFFTFVSLILASNAFAYSTLECSSNKNTSYSLQNRVGGVRPFPGMITNVEEIIKENIVIYRKVIRTECLEDDFCRIQQPELKDINSEDLIFNFIAESKMSLSSEGTDQDPVRKETYAIKFVLGEEMWMLCDSVTALYP